MKRTMRSRKVRREEADLRRAEREKRTNAEQEALLDTRPGESKKERRRLRGE